MRVWCPWAEQTKAPSTQWACSPEQVPPRNSLPYWTRTFKLDALRSAEELARPHRNPTGWWPGFALRCARHPKPWELGKGGVPDLPIVPMPRPPTSSVHLQEKKRWTSQSSKAHVTREGVEVEVLGYTCFYSWGSQGPSNRRIRYEQPTLAENRPFWGTALTTMGLRVMGVVQGGKRGIGGGNWSSLGSHRRVGLGMLGGTLPHELLACIVLLSRKGGDEPTRSAASTRTYSTAQAVGAGPPSAFPKGKAANSPWEICNEPRLHQQRLPVTCYSLGSWRG